MRRKRRSYRPLLLLGSLLLMLAFVTGCSLFSKPPVVADPNAVLQELALSAGQLTEPITAKNFTYTATVPETESTITVRPVARDSKAIISVSINGEEAAEVRSGSQTLPLELEIGNNVVAVDVTLDSKVYSYRITVPKRSVVLQEGSGGYEGMADTQINQATNYRGHNLGGQAKFEVGYSGPWFRDQKYVLVRFDNLPIPDAATVTEATLNLWYYADRISDGEAAQYRDVYVHQILVPWTEGKGGTDTSNDGAVAEPGEVTWNTFMQDTPFDTTVISQTSVGQEPGWYAFELTDLANDWLTNAAPNHGVLLKTDEYVRNEDVVPGTKQFRSREYQVVQERPNLSVVYSMPLQGVTVDRQELELTAGEDPVTVLAFPRPLNAVHDPVEWTSSNEAVVTVNNGVITPVAKGVAVVQATISDSMTNFMSEVNVTVK